MSSQPDIPILDAFAPSGPYRARSRDVVADVTGRPAAELSIVPPLFAHRAVNALRKRRGLPADERLERLARAGEVFLGETIEGQSAAEYRRLVCRVSGLPITLVRQAACQLADDASNAYANAWPGRPAGVLGDWRDPLARTGMAVWVRRGEIFGAHISANHPGVNSGWLQALALGYGAAVRPSRREPFTAHRLAAALRTVGLGDQIAFVPTDHGTAEELIRKVDLSMVFGGDDVMARFASARSVLALGPGRTKVLVTADVDWRDHVELLADSVAHGGGTSCMNASTVLVEGDPMPVAMAIAERLAALPSLPPEDERATLVVQPLDTARRLERYLLDATTGATPILGAGGVCEDLGDGSAVLRPAVHVLANPRAPQVRIELPFPCVWVAPWSREDAMGPLRESLVVTVLTEDEGLAGKLLAEPTIRNVNLGPVPTYQSSPWLPHQGYLSSFLMEAKAFRRA